MERGSRGRSRGRARGRGRGRARGRGKKIAASRIVSSDEEISQEQIEETIITEEITATIDLSAASVVAPEVISEDTTSNKENEENTMTVVTTIEESPVIPQTIDMEADISQLEAPTFTTISRGPPEPMLRLKWDHKVNLIGEKVLNPMIHCCDQCDKPILIYGRMIPCKHVFCLKCARQEPIKICPRCKDKVLRVEQSGLGTVFMCTHGGSRYGSKGCKRTYLSQRDLQAHINHRHVAPQQQPVPVAVVKPSQTIDTKVMNITPRKIDIPAPSSGTISTSVPVTRPLQRPAQSHQFGTTSSSSTSPASSSSRVNLINVPIQEAQQALGKVNIQQHSSGNVPSSLSQHSPAASVEQVASASYYSNALLSYSGPNRPHIHSARGHGHGHVSTQNYHGGIPSIGGSHNVTGVVPTSTPVVPSSSPHGLPLVPPQAHVSSQPSMVPPQAHINSQPSIVPPPPAPPQASTYYTPYGQQYGQLPPPPPPHYQFDQGAAGYPPNPQWNQQQYYR